MIVGFTLDVWKIYERDCERTVSSFYQKEMLAFFGLLKLQGK